LHQTASTDAVPPSCKLSEVRLSTTVKKCIAKRTERPHIEALVSRPTIDKVSSHKQVASDLIQDFASGGDKRREPYTTKKRFELSICEGKGRLSDPWKTHSGPASNIYNPAFASADVHWISIGRTYGLLCSDIVALPSGKSPMSAIMNHGAHEWQAAHERRPIAPRRRHPSFRKIVPTLELLRRAARIGTKFVERCAPANM